MATYHYQCASCYCTLYADASRPGEPQYSIVNGELCESCQAAQNSYNEIDDDYDD